VGALGGGEKGSRKGFARGEAEEGSAEEADGLGEGSEVEGVALEEGAV
jgi:hypothetical protein